MAEHRALRGGITTGIPRTLDSRFGAFVTERYPFAIQPALAALQALGAGDATDFATLERLRIRYGPELRRQLSRTPPGDFGDTTPRVDAARRFALAVDEMVEACDGFFRREALRASLTADER